MHANLTGTGTKLQHKIVALQPGSGHDLSRYGRGN